MFMRLTLHTESSQLICYANQLTGFYMSATLALMGQTQVQEEEVLGLLPEKKNDICFCNAETVTAQKMKFSIKDLFSKCHQIRRRLRIWSHLLNKATMENFIFFVQCCYYMIYLFTISLSISLCFPYTSKAPQ